MDARRVEQSRSCRPFDLINRRDRNQFSLPANQPVDALQYEVPRARDEGTWRRPHEEPWTTQLAQKIRNQFFKLKARICENYCKIYQSLIIVLLATSIFLALFQVITVIMNHYKRPVETSWHMVNPRTATIPAVSICFKYKLDEEKMTDTIGTRKSDIASKSTDPTVGMIINTTPGVDDLVDSCMILNHLSDPVPCSQMSTVGQSIIRNLNCFTWFSEGSWKRPKNETRLTYKIRFIEGEEWVSIKLKNLTTIRGDTIGISIHENHVPVQPDPGDLQFNEFHRTWYPNLLLSKVLLTWQLETRTRLQDPHAISCIDYNKTLETVQQILLKSNDYDVSALSSLELLSPVISSWLSEIYASQREFIDSCIGYSHAAQYNNHWPTNLLAQEMKQRNFFFDYWSTRNSSAHRGGKPDEHFLRANNYRDLCNRLFRYPDCVETTHSIRIITSKYENRPDNMDIALYVPTSFQKHLVETPGYEPSELIAFISGIWVLWVGFSVLAGVGPFLSTVSLLFSLLKRIINMM